MKEKKQPTGSFDGEIRLEANDRQFTANGQKTNGRHFDDDANIDQGVVAVITILFVFLCCSLFQRVLMNTGRRSGNKQ